MNNAILTLLVRIRVVRIHRTVRILLRSPMDRIQANMTAGSICQSWTHNLWADNKAKGRQFPLTQPTMETTGK